MGSNAVAGAMPAVDGGSSPSLLRWGIVVGPFYLAVGLAQALVRDGFVFAKHPLSVLANGPGGWVQTANFVLSGLMVVAAAVGMARALGRGGRAMSWLVGAFGVGMLVAAAFPADPVDGFPVGTPAGPPTSISTTGLLHFAAGGLGFTALAIGCLVGGWVMRTRGAPGLAAFSVGCGIAILVGFFGGALLGPAGIWGIWLAVVVEFLWIGVVSSWLRKGVAPVQAAR